MRIKRVEIIGFKSFCDRAVVQIGESITGVVGPNGCGKSNIVDAIRWCMGEQSAKHLRGKAMEDVIFAGSESRGPAPMAEVSITFDDVGFSHETLELARHSDEAETERAIEALGEDGAPVEVVPEVVAEVPAEVPEVVPEVAPPAAVFLDAEGQPIASPTEEVAAMLADQPPAFEFARFTEVTITRRLYRDGMSQYFINKSPCRLRDITDFFLGTGVGTKAYAIIEQGRIGQIVSSRPADRRAIIEEAAGITKFKAKKKAAERKLDQTRQNLMRVSDIVSELDKRMGTLRRQAQKAERYRKYKTELRDIDLWKSAHRWLELSSEVGQVNARLVEAREEETVSRAEWTTKDAHVVAERAELAVEERRLVGVQELGYELDNRVRLGESKQAFERREADELEGRVAQSTAEIAQLVEQRMQGAAELEQAMAELAGLIVEVEREQGEVSQREALVGEARQMLKNAQGRLEEARGEIGTRRTAIATSEAQLEALGRRRDETTRRMERVVGEFDQASERARDLDREGKKAQGQLAELRQTRFDLGNQSESFAARYELLGDDVSRGDLQVDALRGELSKKQSRLGSLKEIQERYEGFARGTRAVMTRAAEIAEVSAIHGVVADVVRAPVHLEIAVEAVLGDRLGGVLVSESSVGGSAIAFLKQHSGGRSAFVPVTVATAASAPRASVPGQFEGEGNPSSAIEVHALELPPAASPLPVGEGIVGRMAELVDFADGYAGVGKRLFGATIVVDTLDRALALSDAGVRDRLVTLDGDVVDTDGTALGGSRDAQGAGVLAQMREIRELEERVATLEHELSEATALLVTAKAEHKQVGKAIEGLRTQQHEGDLAIMGFEKDESRVRVELDRLRDRLTQLGNEKLELESRLGAIATDETGARERKLAAEDRIAELERVQLDLASDAATHRDQVEELSAVLVEARVRAAQLGEKRAAAESQTLRIEATDTELARRVARLEHDITESTRRASDLRVDCDKLATELEEVRVAHATAVTELETGRQAYSVRLMALAEVELASRDLRTRADALAKEVNALELREGQAAMNRKNVEEGVAERYQLEMLEVIPDFHQRSQITEVEDARLLELKELIDKMGTDINLTAIDEFAEVSTRYEFLSAQQIDLERAVDQLQKAIDKINKTSRKLFKDTFAAVNATFKEVFPRLFRGGQAFLSLSTTPERGERGEDGKLIPGTGGKDKEIDLLEAGIEIFAQPPGKKNTTVDQLSGGEKALTAVALVFSIFLIKPSPFCILDEVDAPLDEANVDRYNEIVREMTDRSQFIVITHNKRTMESADALYGVTMQEPGVSKLVSVNLTRIARGAQKSAANASA